MPNLANDDALKYLVKLGLARSADGLPYPAPFNVVAKTADYTVPAATPCGTLFTNAGDSDAIVFTLPAPAAVPQGQWYLFAGIAAYSVTVATATADTMIAKGDVAADSLALDQSGQIVGHVICAICVTGASAAQWLVFGLSGDDAADVNFTLAT